MSGVDVRGRRLLEGIDLAGEEETVYLSLLEAPSATLTEVARHCQLPRPRTQQALATLEASGLVSRSPRTPPRFLPTSPDVALEVLVLRKEEQLKRTRLAAEQLSRRFRRQQRDRSVELVEVVTGADAILQRFAQLRRAATKEMLMFDKPPYVAGSVGSSEPELHSLGRGVVWRVLYDRQALEVPGQLEDLRELIAAGEQARTLDGLPMKLAVANRCLAFVPLEEEDPAEGMVVVHPSALLTAITMLFDSLWERALPIRIHGTQLHTTAALRSATEQLDEHIISLLASGLQDQAIGHQLGVGHRTVQRHVGQIMDALGAATRFQAGWTAAQRQRRSAHTERLSENRVRG